MPFGLAGLGDAWTIAAVCLVWLQATHLTGYRVWQYIVLAVVTVLVTTIATRTLVAISRRQLLPQPPKSTASTAPAARAGRTDPG